MNPVMLAIAPVPKISSGIPFDYSPRHIADEVIACAQQGAVMAHLHVLDAEGNETTDISVFDETVRLIRMESDIIIQGSTGGSPSQPLAERCVSLEHHMVQTASLNMGSVNFGDEVYINPLPDIRAFAARMSNRKISAEMEVFDLSMIYVGMKLVKERLIPPHFNLCFGFENALPAREEILAFLMSRTHEVEDSLTGILHHGALNLSFIKTALIRGADILRVGFEDSTIGADDNEELFSALLKIAEISGRKIADISQAKLRIGVRY